MLAIDSGRLDNRNLPKGIMKKYIVLALSLTLLIPAPSFSAPKKPVVKSVVKKPVAKKPVVKKAVVKPTPAPSPSAVVEAPKVVEPSPTPTPTPTKVSAASIDNLDAKSVYARSRQEVSDAIEKSSYVNTFLNFNIGPNQNASIVSTERESIALAARLWSNVYQPKTQLEILFYDFKDLDWARAKFSQITGTSNFYSANSCFANYCGNASAGRVGNSPWIFEQGLGGSLWNKSTSAHEYTHLAQASSNPDYWNIAPIWLVEGMAQFYGEAIGYSPFDSKLITRGEMHRQYASDFKSANLGDMKTLLAKNDPATVKSLMNLVEFPNPRHGQATTAAAYLLGSYGTEVLVAVYGHSAVEQFLKSFSTSSDWKTNFNKSFGITSEEFYSKLTPYLYEMSKEL